MPISLRAKQFMPFAAVTGLDEAIRQVEIKVENKKEVERIPDGEELLEEEKNLSDEDILWDEWLMEDDYY